MSEEAGPAVAADPAVAPPLLLAQSLTKHFPGVTALDDVDFSVAPGEIVALLGQNGAGKSTLIQIIAGAHPAGSYAGTIELRGQPYRPAGVAAAERAGIALVPQEVNIVPDLTVAENITLNDEPMRWGAIDVARRQRIARDALREFALDVDPAAPMSSLDLATQQLVVIARALAKKARLLILDEPTAALTQTESHRLFEHMRTLKTRGVAVIFVSHRLSEIFAVSDRIVVMRDGRVRGRYVTANVTRSEIVTAMIGELVAPAERPPPVLGSLALEVRNLSVLEPSGRPRVEGLDLAVREGEVVGLFGLLGSGCIEAALAIYGAWAGPHSGDVRVRGASAVIGSPEDAVALGLGLMAQDRRDCLIADHSICDNIGIASLDRVASGGVLDIGLARRRAQDHADQLSIKATSIDAEVQTLSGGNQQKVQIARWLAAETAILVMIDPTRGVDVGARRDIKAIWSALSARGQAILLASTDVEELVDSCDRVVVMANGRPAGELSGAGLTEKELVRMAADG